jgi:hypothetical protein
MHLIELDWSIPCAVVNRTTTDSKLLLFSQQSGLKQIVTSPSHDNNFTDLIFISHDSLMFNVNVDMPFSTSDHSTLEIFLQSGVLKSMPDSLHRTLPATIKLYFDEIDHAGLSAQFVLTDWSLCFSLDDDIEYASGKFSACYIINCPVSSF